VEEAAHRTVRALASAGIVYVLPASARGVERALQVRGLRSAESLLHVPDAARSRHVVPLGTAAARYALSGQLRMKSTKRMAAKGLSHSRWLRDRAPTGLVFRREASAPLGSWLTELGDRSSMSSALAMRRSDGGAVLLRFPADEPRPNAVAKVSRSAPREVEALQRIAPPATRAGVRAPGVIFSGTLGAVPVVLQSALPGTIAARLLEQKRLRPAELHERLADWLTRWGTLSRREREMRTDELERLVLSPAARLVPDKPAYRQHLSVLCGLAVGSRCPSVASHGDLTASNVLIDQTGLGVIDWEEALEESLPLTDFFYAAADAVAAVGGYMDRPGAFAACFAADGEHAGRVGELTHRLAKALDVSPVIQEICFHVCWLHHADNERRRSHADGARPFASILNALSAWPERFAPDHNRRWSAP